MVQHGYICIYIGVCIAAIRYYCFVGLLGVFVEGGWVIYSVFLIQQL